MATASLSFVLVTAALGMGIVFLFLAMLSLLMRLIRGIDEVAGASTREAGGAPGEARGRRAGRRGAGADTTAGAGGRPSARGRTGSAAGGAADADVAAGGGDATAGGGNAPAASLPFWAIAAAAAYLDAEQEAHRTSASPWTARFGR